MSCAGHSRPRKRRKPSWRRPVVGKGRRQEGHAEGPGKRGGGCRALQRGGREIALGGLLPDVVTRFGCSLRRRVRRGSGGGCDAGEAQQKGSGDAHQSAERGAAYRSHDDLSRGCEQGSDPSGRPLGSGGTVRLTEFCRTIVAAVPVFRGPETDMALCGHKGPPGARRVKLRADPITLSWAGGVDESNWGSAR